MDKGLRGLRDFVLCCCFFFFYYNFKMNYWYVKGSLPKIQLGLRLHYKQSWPLLRSPKVTLRFGSWVCNHKANFVKIGAKFGFPWWCSGKEFCLPGKGTQVQPLTQEDSTCRGAAKPMHYIIKATGCSDWCLHAPQPKICKREATTMRSPRITTESSSHLPQLEKILFAAMKTQHSQKK